MLIIRLGQIKCCVSGIINIPQKLGRVGMYLFYEVLFIHKSCIPYIENMHSITHFNYDVYLLL